MSSGQMAASCFVLPAGQFRWQAAVMSSVQMMIIAIECVAVPPVVVARRAMPPR